MRHTSTDRTYQFLTLPEWYLLSYAVYSVPCSQSAANCMHMDHSKCCVSTVSNLHVLIQPCLLLLFVMQIRGGPLSVAEYMQVGASS